MEKLYTYAVARVKVREAGLLSAHDIEQLVSSKSYEECLRLLSDKGYENGVFKFYDELILKEQQKTWNFIAELTDDLSVFDVFRIGNDFHNLKAAIKVNFSGYKPERIYISGGTLDSECFEKAVKEGDFSELPDIFKEAAETAVSVLNKTGDGQRCDMVLDKAEYRAKLLSAKKTENSFLIEYTKLCVDFFALKTAFRCMLLSKDRDFLKSAVPEDCSFDISELSDAVFAGKDAFREFIAKAGFNAISGSVDASVAEFEKHCDNYLMDFVKKQKWDSLTIAPVASYILARENELKMVRIILSAKLNGFSEEIVRERMRDMYV